MYCGKAYRRAYLYLARVPRYRRYLRRERNLLALPTLDMYLPLFKFGVYTAGVFDTTV